VAMGKPMQRYVPQARPIPVVAPATPAPAAAPAAELEAGGPGPAMPSASTLTRS
jgi:hypothetical protein